MIEAKLEAGDIERFAEVLEGAPAVVKDAKRQAFEAAAPKLLSEVRRQIGGAGKVQSWQDMQVGSRGGYAAVRPRAGAYTDPTRTGKRYAVGYVTNAIESGHRFPTPTGKNRDYRPRMRSGAMKVPGKQFYAKAEARADAIAQQAVEQVAEALAAHLEG